MLGLIVLGGPAGVGVSLLFAHLKHAGAAPADVVNTRAVFSFAWVAGPPLAALLMGWSGSRAILAAIAAGAAIGVAAGLEIPALLLIGRLSRRFADPALIATGCLAGVLYYVAVAYVSGPVVLIALQLLNAWFFATVAGVGLTLFQRVIPRPGLASGLYTNTRRLGAVVSGPIIGLGAATALRFRGVFLLCAALTMLALLLVASTARKPRPAS